MIAYVDSSVVLRVALREPQPLASWRRLARAFTSELCRVECYRVLDRLRLSGTLDDREIAERREIIDSILDGLEIATVDRRILRRAGDPMPTTLGTLDAIHVATAVAIRRRHSALQLCSHDEAMLVAARALGFRVLS